MRIMLKSWWPESTSGRGEARKRKDVRSITDLFTWYDFQTQAMAKHVPRNLGHILRLLGGRGLFLI